jgi:hypothetical protein
MTLVSFDLQFQGELPGAVDLPIEVRKPNMALAERTLSSQAVDLAPGTYFASVKLPTGQEISQQIQVGDEPARVSLTQDPEDEPAPKPPNREHFALDRIRLSMAVRPVLEPLGAAEPMRARLRLVAGNLLTKGYEIRHEWPGNLPAPGQEVRVEIVGEDRPLIVQLLQPDLPPLNIALPAWYGRRATLVLKHLPKEHCGLRMEMEHVQAELLLQYRESGLLREVAAAVSSTSLDAEKLLADKVSDPVAAAVGGYALLRFGDLGRLHDWTENLRKLFPGLPDGAAIRGEHLARLGRHPEALTSFLELGDRGLPLFSYGISRAVERLRLYLGVKEQAFPPADLVSAQALLDRLQVFINFIDFDKPVTTFTGLDPGQPNGEVLQDLGGIEDSLDLGGIVT